MAIPSVTFAARCARPCALKPSDKADAPKIYRSALHRLHGFRPACISREERPIAVQAQPCTCNQDRVVDACAAGLASACCHSYMIRPTRAQTTLTASGNFEPCFAVLSLPHARLPPPVSACSGSTVREAIAPCSRHCVLLQRGTTRNFLGAVPLPPDNVKTTPAELSIRTRGRDTPNSSDPRTATCAPPPLQTAGGATP